jgi:hypothetical protein
MVQRGGHQLAMVMEIEQRVPVMGARAAFLMNSDINPT